MAIEIDNDNDEIRIDGYEYANAKVSVKTYGVSSENSLTGNSADLRLTGNDSSTDNVTFTGGANVTVVRTDANKITISASANDTNTTYGVSSQNSQTGNSADLRLTGSDSSTDNVTFTGGANVTVISTDVNKITISASANDTNTTYGISAETNATPNRADIRLTGSDSTTDNLTLVGGTNVTVVRNDANTITLSSSEQSIVLANNIVLVAPPGVPITSFFSIPSVSGNETVELRGIILLQFSGQSNDNRIQFTLATTGTFNYAGINIQVGNTNVTPSIFQAQVGEVTSSNIGIQTSSMNDTNIHAVSISGVIRNGGTTASPSLNINNLSATSTLTILTKSFIKYNKI